MKMPRSFKKLAAFVGLILLAMPAVTLVWPPNPSPVACLSEPQAQLRMIRDDGEVEIDVLWGELLRGRLSGLPETTLPLARPDLQCLIGGADAMTAWSDEAGVHVTVCNHEQGVAFDLGQRVSDLLMAPVQEQNLCPFSTLVGELTLQNGRQAWLVKPQ